MPIPRWRLTFLLPVLENEPWLIGSPVTLQGSLHASQRFILLIAENNDQRPPSTRMINEQIPFPLSRTATLIIVHNCCRYTRRRFGGDTRCAWDRQMSVIDSTVKPALCSERTADSRPDPGPFNTTHHLAQVK